MQDTSVGVSIANMTKGKLPRLPFTKMVQSVFTSGYDLSILIASPSVAQRLNRIYRKKDYPPTILSYSLSAESGEIILEPRAIKKQALEFGTSYSNLIGFLFIHGLLHLKGFDHGSTMKRKEEKLCAYFGITPPSNRV